MKCWFCKEGQMHQAEDLGYGWYKCSSCGATYIEMLRVKKGRR